MRTWQKNLVITVDSEMVEFPRELRYKRTPSAFQSVASVTSSGSPPFFGVLPELISEATSRDCCYADYAHGSVASQVFLSLVKSSSSRYFWSYL